MTHASFDHIFPICRDVERKIVGQTDERICDWWGAKNAFRHGLTLAFLERLSTSKGGTPLKIFNMSGLSCGHQDFSIAHYLHIRGIAFEYHALEHPATPYRNNAEFMTRVRDNGIDILWEDLGELEIARIRDRIGTPDVILFTEIAEHLEHGDFLRSLALAHEGLGSEGRLVLTTPNRDRLKYRFKILAGQDIDYWGEGIANQASGLYGHIVYYSIPRLRRLLSDAGFELEESVSVDFPFPNPLLPSGNRWWHRQRLRLTRVLIATGEKSWRVPRVMNALKTLGEQLFIVARKGPRKEIPLAL